MNRSKIMNSVFYTALLFMSGLLLGQSPMNGDPGIFLEDWKPKKSPMIKVGEEVKYTGDATVSYSVDFSDTLTKISPYLFGNNTGTWMGRAAVEDMDFMFALKDMNCGVLRFPGGNLANDYFWNATSMSDMPAGVPDQFVRNKFTGRMGQPKPGQLGTWMFNPDAFYDVLLRTKATGSICVNYSYALYGLEEDPEKRVQIAADYAAEWVRDVNIKRKLGVKYWEVGNENWGQWQAGYYVEGRGFIDPEDYGKHFQVFVKAMKAVDPTIKIGAVGYQKPKGSDPQGVMDDWNKKVYPHVADYADFIALHSYFTKHGRPASPSEMLESLWHCAEHQEVTNKAMIDFAGKKAKVLPIAMTEFNTHSTATIKAKDGAANVSHTAGLFIGNAFGEFARQGYGSAMMWDLFNGYAEGRDHGVFATPKESDVPVYTPHPSWFHFYLYSKCFGDVLYEPKGERDKVVFYPSSFSDGAAGLVLINKTESKQVVELKLENLTLSEDAYVYEVTSDDPLSRKTWINGQSSGQVAGGPDNMKKVKAKLIKQSNGILTLEMTPFSASYVLIKAGK